MSPLSELAWLTIVLIGLFCLTALNAALRQYKKKQIKRQPDIGSKLFFYQYFHRWCLPTSRCEELFFVNSLAQHMLRFAYALLSFLLVIQWGWFQDILSISESPLLHYSVGILILLVLFAVQFLVGDYLPKIFGNRYPRLAIRLGSAPSSIFMIIA